MKRCETLICARWVATVEPDNIVIDDGAVAIDSGRIVTVDTRTKLLEQFEPDRLVSRDSHLLIPGLINAHTHAAMTLLRGAAEDLPLQQWLENGVWPIETEHVGPEMVRDGTRLAMLESIKGGVTCFNDMYFFPDVAAEVASAARMRVSLGLPIIEFPTAWAATADEYLAKAQDTLDALRANPLITTQFAPHSPYTVTPDTLTRVRTIADQLDAMVHIHLQETQGEVDQGLSTNGKRPTEFLNDIGLLNRNFLAAHMVAATSDDLALFRDHYCNVVHCPSSNLKLASGMAPIAEMLDYGINVAIGTDGAASNNSLDMIAETRLAGLVAKGREGDATVLPSATLLRMATINGAQALGIAEQTGSLESGKWADIAVVNLGAVHCQPVYDPIAALFYSANRSDVTDVWVAGKALLEQGEPTTLDAERIQARTQEWHDRIRG
ncbi:MAG: TRZ/ATZ family hydrolase [Pseudomonadota bacterium]